MDNVIAAMEANHPRLTTQKGFYVEISRARDKAELVTDDRAALKEQLEAVTGKRIAALEAVEPDKAKGRERGPDVNRSASHEDRPLESREPQRMRELNRSERDLALLDRRAGGFGGCASSRCGGGQVSTRPCHAVRMPDW